LSPVGVLLQANFLGCDHPIGIGALRSRGGGWAQVHADVVEPCGGGHLVAAAVPEPGRGAGGDVHAVALRYETVPLNQRLNGKRSGGLVRLRHLALGIGRTASSAARTALYSSSAASTADQ